MLTRYLNQKLYRISLACFVLVVFLGVVLNLPRERVRIYRWYAPSSAPELPEENDAIFMTGGHLGFSGWLPPESAERFAGWPMAVPMVESLADAPPNFPLVMLANFAVITFLGIIVAVLGALLQSVRSSWHAWLFASRRQFLVGATFVATLTLVGLAGGVRTAVEQNQLRKELRRFGTVAGFIELPVIFAGAFPLRTFDPLVRLDTVQLHSPPLELLVRVQQNGSLRTASIEGSVIDAAMWKQLVHDSGITSLCFTKCTFEPDVCELPSKAKSVKTLKLKHCGGVESLMSSIPNFSALTSLEIVGESVAVPPQLDQWLPAGVKHLQLAINFDTSQKLSVVGMSELESLHLNVRRHGDLSLRFGLELNDLPKLATLTLPFMLPVDLTIKSLPRLRSIESRPHHPSFYDDMSGDDDAIRFVSLPIVNLDIQGAPGLQELRLDPSSLQTFRIKETPNLRTLSIAMAGWWWGQSTTDRKSRAARVVEWRDTWLTALADCDGPVSLDLESLPLDGVDLSPLRLNTRLRALNLKHTSVSASQVLAIDDGGRLKSLALNGCVIDHEGLQSLLNAYPNIEQLTVDTGSLDKLEIIDRPQLKTLFAPASMVAKHVTIKGSPNLSGALRLGRNVEHLQIMQAASLKTLSVLGKLPPNVVLDGLLDLEVVEMAGENLTDKQFMALLNCKDLKELTLAMSHISSDSLKAVGSFLDLITLKLPGSQVDDQAVSHWQGLKSLTIIDLSHTKITGKSFETLFQNQGIQRLNFNHSMVRADDFHAIQNLPNLIELEVAGVGLTADTLRFCVNSYMLDRINLSNSVVTDEMVDLLASPAAHHLLFVGLKRCGLSEQSIRKIADAHPRMAMDIVGNKTSDSFVQTFSNSGRLIACHDRPAFERWIENLAGNLDVEESYSTVEKQVFQNRPYSQWFSNPTRARAGIGNRPLGSRNLPGMRNRQL